MDRSDDAIKDCTSAVLLHPQYLKAYLRRADLYDKAEKYEEATKDCTEWREIDYRLVATGETLEVVAECDYVEPMITRSVKSPYDGHEFTCTLPQSQVGTHMDPLCESHYTR